MMYPNHVALRNAVTADDILKWAVEQGASDISFAPNEPVWMRLNGEWHPILQQSRTNSEIEALLSEFSKQPSAASQARSGQDVDFRYEITVSRGKRVRFRCNATGCQDGWGSGVSMVLRTIPELPPKLEVFGLPAELVTAFKPKYGLVLVTGPVGSGKSTLLSSVLRDIAEQEPKHILTYEAPIEFDLMGIPERRSLVVQTEVPRHLKSFDVAPRNSLRRAGDVILFGEARDKETLRNMAIEAETGVAVYSTVHTNSVAETISRIVREFPHDERDSMIATLVSAMRLIVHQRLVVNATGDGRVALREWLIFDEYVQDSLIRTRSEDLIPVMQELVESHGRPITLDAIEHFKAGRISEVEYRAFVPKDKDTLAA